MLHMLKQRIAEFLSGLIFGLGLILAGMTNPAKVLAFLDLRGKWDPSLALVMGAGVGIGLLAFSVAKRNSHSYLHQPMLLPLTTSVDKRLIGGSLMFGIGWGLTGFCPGPAIVSLAFGRQGVYVFVIAMLSGMAIFEFFERNSRRSVT